MKKIGLIALALITVLATLGVGFSMWFSTITINGNVNTGSVSLAISNPTGTWAFKDMDSGIGGDTEANWAWVAGQETWPLSGTVALPNPSGTYTTTDTDVFSEEGWQLAPNLGGPAIDTDHVIYGWAGVTGINTTTNTVTLGYGNLFPVPVDGSSTAGGFETWCADFDVENTGTIPVIFEVGNLTTNMTGAYPGITVMASVGAEGETTPITLQGYQVEPLQTIHVMVCLAVNESTTQNIQGGTFSFTITGVQWNEYSAPPSSSPI